MKIHSQISKETQNHVFLQASQFSGHHRKSCAVVDGWRTYLTSESSDWVWNLGRSSCYRDLSRFLVTNVGKVSSIKTLPLVLQHVYTLKLMNSMTLQLNYFLREYLLITKSVKLQKERRDSSVVQFTNNIFRDRKLPIDLWQLSGFCMASLNSRLIRHDIIGYWHRLWKKMLLSVVHQSTNLPRHCRWNCLFCRVFYATLLLKTHNTWNVVVRHWQKQFY